MHSGVALLVNIEVIVQLNRLLVHSNFKSITRKTPVNEASRPS